MSPQIKGLIFDLGSTLIEYENRNWDDIFDEGEKLAYDNLNDNGHDLPGYDIFHQRFLEFRMQKRESSRRTLIEWNVVEAPKAILSELGLKDVERLSREFIDVMYTVVSDQVTICEGAADILSELKAGKYKIGLISNTIFEPYLHNGDLDKFGLTSYLDFKIYSSQFGKRKPDPSIYRSGLKLIGLSPAETMFVGDRYAEDVEGPERAGMKGVLKYWPGREYPDPLPKNTTVIKKLSELLNILKS